MLKVFSAGNILDAYLVQSLLTEAGIETQIHNEFAQGGTGEIPFTQATRKSGLLMIETPTVQK